MIGLLVLLVVMLGFSGVLWFFLGPFGVAMFLVGILGYITLPLLLRRTGYTRRLGGFFLDTGFRFIGRFLLVAHQNGGYSIVASRFDPDKGTETAWLNGRRGDWMDHLNSMSKLRNVSFGIVTDHIGIVLDLRIAEIGQRFDELVAADEHRRVQTYRDDTGRTWTEEQFAKFLEMSEEMVPVDIRKAVHIMPGDADPFSVEVGEKYVTFSKEKYGQTFGKMTYGAWILAFIVGAGIMYFALRLGGNGEGGTNESSGDIIPIVIEVMPV